MDLSVCIVNWNTREDLARCLTSLVGRSWDIEYEVWVVDNASQDSSGDLVRTRFPTVNLVVNAENRGFAAANNQAIQQSQGRYILLLNPDTIVHEGALNQLVWFLDTHPAVGIAGLKLLNPDGSLQYSCRTFPTWGAVLFRGTLLGRLFPHNRFTREYLMQDWPHNEVRRVDWVSGAGLAVRRKMLAQIGLLDERFFMYCEDMDLCRRAWDAGWEVVYFPEAVVTHFIGRSSDQNLGPMIVEFHRSMYRYVGKHLAPRYGPAVKVLAGVWLTLRAVSILAGSLKRRARPL